MKVSKMAGLSFLFVATQTFAQPTSRNKVEGTLFDGYYVTNCTCVVYVGQHGETRQYRINASGSSCGESMNNARVQCDAYINASPRGTGYTSGCIDCQKIN